MAFHGKLTLLFLAFSAGRYSNSGEAGPEVRVGRSCSDTLSLSLFWRFIPPTRLPSLQGNRFLESQPPVERLLVGKTENGVDFGDLVIMMFSVFSS